MPQKWFRTLPILLALLLLAPIAGAAPPLQTGDLSGAAIYILQLSDPAAASYRGGIHDLPATSPRVTGAAKMDVDSPASRAYLDYLRGKQDQLLLNIEQTLGRPVEPLQRYQYAFNGLALQLLPEEAAEIAALPGLRQVQRDRLRQLLTDYGPQWMGAGAIWDGLDGIPASRGEGVIVGVIDSGINLDSPSFADTGGDSYDHSNPLGDGVYRGWCDPANPDYDPALPCNDKLIGVWSWPDSGGDPEDDHGHGSHTASTAAGNVVDPATLNAPTTSYSAPISGVAPHANIIAYDACTPAGCPLSVLVAAIDQTIPDRVDVINYSIGGPSSDPWFDPDSLAFLAAADAGIVPVTSAGNGGPAPASIGSPADAPWVISVAANSHNRKPVNALVGLIGDGDPPPANISGKSITAGYGPAPIVYAGDYGDALCQDPFPADTWIRNEIVLCDRGVIARVAKGYNVAQGGAGGLILANDAANDASLNADPHVIPAVHISYQDGLALKAWLASGTYHKAAIAGTTMSVDDLNGDIIAAFSSRGPNPATYNVLKPDLTAPGVDIFAAYKTGHVDPADPTTIGEEYWILSGTSMSSPHVAGAAALLKAIHPNWSPHEIKSALMSTARTSLRKEDELSPADPFDMGAGHVDLAQAGRAGLILDETSANFNAADPVLGGDPATLNLASLSNDLCSETCSWTRTVKNPTDSPMTWQASYTGPGAAIVTPALLDLAPGQSASFTVDLNVRGLPLEQWNFGSLGWTETAQAAPDVHLPVVFWTTLVSPQIETDPAALSHTQAPGSQENVTLTINNQGDGDLTWQIDETETTCDAPGDVAWLGVDPASGSTAAGRGSAVAVSFDTSGLAEQIYEALLCIASNDPLTPLLALPVTLTVQRSGVDFCPLGSAPTPVYASDLESDNGGWTIGGFGDWEWGSITTGQFENCGDAQTEPAAAHSGDKVWANNLDGCYANSGDESLLISRTVDLSQRSAPIQLSWWNWHSVYVTFDTGEVYVNDDKVWEIDTRDAVDWQRETVDLSAYAGQANVEVTFRLYATTVVNRMGWYLDDIALESCAPTSQPDIDVSPASFATRLAPGDQRVDTLAILNLGDATLTWQIAEDAPAPAKAAGGPADMLRQQAPPPAPARSRPDLATAPDDNLIADPSFEAGTPNPSWTEASSNFGTPLCNSDCSGPPAAGGDWYAWFGGINSYEEGSLEQTLAIPASATSLSFDLWTGVCDSEADTVELLIDNIQVFHSGPCTENGGYQTQTVDVSAFADNSIHTLRFHSETFAANNTHSNFFLDQLDLQGTTTSPCTGLADIPWLSLSQSSGSAEAASQSTVQLTFDTNGYDLGAYPGNLCITSNDPDQPLVIVPLTLTVEHPTAVVLDDLAAAANPAPAGLPLPLLPAVAALALAAAALFRPTPGPHPE